MSNIRNVSQLIEPGYFRTIHRPFGFQSDRAWRHLTETSLRRTDDGMVTPHYDPRIVLQFDARPADDPWQDYDRIDVPTLCLRGVKSDILLPETAAEMQRRGPRCRVEEVPGVGHAPTLDVTSQTLPVQIFLES
jgi:pimeloyl-ACP methyl ester carboxylesterase